MAIEYLNDHYWSDWSRDERFFCAVLFEHGRQNPADFARWVNDTASLGLPMAGSHGHRPMNSMATRSSLRPTGCTSLRRDR